MTNLKKLILTALALCLCLCPLSYTAQAADLVDPDNISSIAQYFGADLSDPESVQGLINQIEDGGLSGIMKLLGIDITEVIGDLEKYLATMDTTTQATTTEATTQTEATETTTAEITTEATTQEATTAKPVVETTVVEKPVYITVTEKPAAEEKTEATTEKAEEITTEEAATEAENETAAVQDNESENSEISDKTIFVIISTVSIFFVGLIAGIGITKYLSNKQRLLEE